jgi:hypothetical protein
MAAIELLRKRATAITGAPPPGDARAAARVLADLCEHVGVLENAVAELIRQLDQAKSEIAALKNQEKGRDQP